MRPVDSERIAYGVTKYSSESAAARSRRENAGRTFFKLPTAGSKVAPRREWAAALSGVASRCTLAPRVALR